MLARFANGFRSAGTALMVLGLFAIGGGHWAVLQTVAWAQMLRDYSRDASMIEAVGKTFSGEEPCAMCKRIASARQEEERTPANVNLELKSVSFLPAPAAGLRAPVWKPFDFPVVSAGVLPLRCDPPPVPVPIGFA